MDKLEENWNGFHLHFLETSLPKGLCPLSRNFSVRTGVNKIEAIYEMPRVNVKVERGSPFTFSLDLPYIVSIYAPKIYNRSFFLQISGSLLPSI